MPDLWPDDIATAKMPVPLAILKEQATALGQKTHNVVEGEVRSVQDESRPGQSNFVYAFYIVGPALGGYRYRLLTIAYPVETYPVEISLEPEILTYVRKELRENALPNTELVFDDLDDLTSRKLIARSEDAFKAALKAVFNASKTRRVIEAVIAQSTT
jgi:hypothetical protein